MPLAVALGLLWIAAGAVIGSVGGVIGVRSARRVAKVTGR